MSVNTLQYINENKVIAIIRKVDCAKVVRVADALYEGGIRALEITFRQDSPQSFAETAKMIASVGEKYDGLMLIGAGTVLTRQQLFLSQKAGARFVVSPNVNEDIIKSSLDMGMVPIPGAMTPTEIVSANNFGADYVKVFPAADLGPGYIRSISVPLSHINLIGVGGICSDNARTFMDAGVCGVGVGGKLISSEAVAMDNYDVITKNAIELISSIR